MNFFKQLSQVSNILLNGYTLVETSILVNIYSVSDETEDDKVKKNNKKLDAT